MIDMVTFFLFVLIFAISDGFKEMRIRKIEETLTDLIKKQEKD